jgi:hypothetical protein
MAVMAEQEAAADARRKYDELRLLYSVCVSDITEFKALQWRITNYGLLLYAAIVSVPKLLTHLSPLEVVVLYLLAVAILLTGWHLIKGYHRSIRNRRERLIAIRREFTDEFKLAWRAGKSSEQLPDRIESASIKTSLLWLFQTIFALGFLIVFWLLYRLV